MNKRSLILLFSFISLTGCSGTIPKLGLNNGNLIPCPDSPNCVSTQEIDEEHFIEPIYFIGTAQDLQERLLKILEGFNRAEVTDLQDHYIRVEFRSRIFRFVDDVEFYFPPVKKMKITIEVRSASRIGYSDLGANRKRIEQIREMIN